jgi:hypothetical protein
MVGAQRFFAENLSNDIRGGIEQSRANVLRSQPRGSGRGRIAWNRRLRLGHLGIGAASKSCANNSDIVCQGDIPQENCEEAPNVPRRIGRRFELKC